MFGTKDVVSAVEIDVSQPLTDEAKERARESTRKQLEARGATRETIEQAMASLDELFGNWSPAGLVAMKLDALAELVDRRLPALRAAGHEVTKVGQEIEERADHIYECGRANACIGVATAALAMAVETLREVANEQRDEKPEAVGEA